MPCSVPPTSLQISLVFMPRLLPLNHVSYWIRPPRMQGTRFTTKLQSQSPWGDLKSVLFTYLLYMCASVCILCYVCWAVFLCLCQRAQGGWKTTFRNHFSCLPMGSRAVLGLSVSCKPLYSAGQLSSPSLIWVLLDFHFIFPVVCFPLCFTVLSDCSRAYSAQSLNISQPNFK